MALAPEFVVATTLECGGSIGYKTAAVRDLTSLLRNFLPWLIVWPVTTPAICYICRRRLPRGRSKLCGRKSCRAADNRVRQQRWARRKRQGRRKASVAA